MVTLTESDPSDAPYRARREQIAEIGRRYQPGQPIPDVAYSPKEDATWRTVSGQLARQHQVLACAEYLRGAARLDLPADRVPQLREVDERLRALTGFGIEPVAGLVPTREFYAALARRRFLSTQYVRHHSAPFYTPEPDIIHEIIGHANMLASPGFADLYERAGQASLRARSDAALAFFSRVFWFTLEFGVLWEGDELRAYGAGLLSSYGEIQVFRQAEITPIDIGAMGRRSYDITHFQPTLFTARSFEDMLAVLGDFFDHYDDDAYARLGES